MSKESDGPVVWTLHLCLWGRAKVYMQKLHITCPHVKASDRWEPSEMHFLVYTCHMIHVMTAHCCHEPSHPGLCSSASIPLLHHIGPADRLPRNIFHGVAHRTPRKSDEAQLCHQDSVLENSTTNSRNPLPGTCTKTRRNM